MKLTKEKYTVSRATLEEVIDALNNNWFVSVGDGEEYNNEDVISAQHSLEDELKRQEG
jgi:hypothetical protein